jgi:hypothetical protein
MVIGSKLLIALVLPAIAYRLMDAFQAYNGHVMTDDLQCTTREAIKQRDTYLGRYLQLCSEQLSEWGCGVAALGPFGRVDHGIAIACCVELTPTY